VLQSPTGGGRLFRSSTERGTSIVASRRMGAFVEGRGQEGEGGQRKGCEEERKRLEICGGEKGGWRFPVSRRGGGDGEAGEGGWWGGGGTHT